MEYFSTALIKASQEYPCSSHNSCETVSGSLPVLLSVPHCVTHTRNGKPKPAELNTLALALMLHKACGCHVIYNCDGSYDPNYDENDPYKCRVREYIHDNDIRFLIDLHGASRERTLDIEIGTSDGNNIGGDTDLVKLFVCIASLSFNHIVVDEHFKASGGNTVSSFVHHDCGIPAIQAEINMRNRDEKDPLLFEKTASVFADYIKMLTLCGYSMRYHDCACVHVAKSTHPHNRVELPLAWKEYHTIGETCVITSVVGQKECRIKAFVQNSDSIAVGRRIFDGVFKRLPVALVARSESIRAKVYKPKVEAIDNTAISVSDDLFELFGQNRYAEVFNPVSGIRAYLRVKRYTHNFNNRTNAVWLSFLQRRLLNMELPVILSPSVQAHLKQAAGEDQYQYFISQYHTNANGELKLEKMDEETHARMKRIFATVSSSVELRPVNDCDAPFKSQPEILSRCIGNASIMLRSVRCTENDEILDSIMLTATNLKRLGISDGDKATVSYRGRHLTVRVHELRHDSFQNVIRNNNLDSPDDIDMVACMPVILRFRLGLSDINDCVTIERNLPYIVRKNITEQLLALIGLFIALTGIPGVSFIGSFIAFLALAPLVLYSIFSKEREKI